MNFIPTAIPDVFIIEPHVIGDHRGYFYESFRQQEFDKHMGVTHFVQENESKSSYGVLRGLHYQLPPHAQAKLVRVQQGKVLDIAVDIRKNSKTFGQHVAIELSEENKRQLFIPKGFAHGFITLSETAVFAYKCDNYYHKDSERCILYNDSAFNIDWQVPVDARILSEKDINGTPFSAATLFNS